MPTPRTSDPRFHDFDADFAEADTIPFKLLGKVWELPGSVPAATILKVQRLMLQLAKMEETGEVPDDLVIDADLSPERMCRELAGDDVVDAWLAKGIRYEMLMAVSRRLFAIHTGSDPDADDAPAGKAPARPRDRQVKSSPRKRSSSTGR